MKKPAVHSKTTIRKITFKTFLLSFVYLTALFRHQSHGYYRKVASPLKNSMPIDTWYENLTKAISRIIKSQIWEEEKKTLNVMSNTAISQNLICTRKHQNSINRENSISKSKVKIHAFQLWWLFPWLLRMTLISLASQRDRIQVEETTADAREKQYHELNKPLAGKFYPFLPQAECVKILFHMGNCLSSLAKSLEYLLTVKRGLWLSLWGSWTR